MPKLDLKSLNGSQRVIIAVAGLIAAAVVLFPPHRIETHIVGGRTAFSVETSTRIDHRWIGSAKRAGSADEALTTTGFSRDESIAVLWLIGELILLGGLTYGGLYLFGDW